MVKAHKMHHSTILFLPVPFVMVEAQVARQLQTEWASDPAPIAFAPTATTTAISATVLLRLLLVSLLLV